MAVLPNFILIVSSNPWPKYCSLRDLGVRSFSLSHNPRTAVTPGDQTWVPLVASQPLVYQCTDWLLQKILCHTCGKNTLIRAWLEVEGTSQDTGGRPTPSRQKQRPEMGAVTVSRQILAQSVIRSLRDTVHSKVWRTFILTHREESRSSLLDV